ncbi:MAG: hypothetical protein HY814_10780 [Candidatus Riflebacteria bacterium]|nr:hypothetical protein [Candidatus Riflebacteria bacterium]
MTRSADYSTKLFDLFRPCRVSKEDLALLRATQPWCDDLDEYVEFLDANWDLFPPSPFPRQTPVNARFRL